MKKLALVLALGFSSLMSNAYAATYAATASGDGYVFSASYAGTTEFNDLVSFSTTGLDDIIASISGTGNKSFIFTSFNLLDASQTLVSEGSIFSGGTKASFGAVEGLGSGNYFLQIVGKSTGATAGYSGTITLTAVPEPETNALLIAGIGMLGLIARRKFS